MYVTQVPKTIITLCRTQHDTHEQTMIRLKKSTNTIQSFLS